MKRLITAILLTVTANATELSYDDLTSYQEYSETVTVLNNNGSVVGFDKYNRPTFVFETHGLFRMESTCAGFDGLLEASTIRSLKGLVNLGIFSKVNNIQIVPCSAIYPIK